MNDLVIIEKQRVLEQQLEPLLPKFAEVLAGTMPVERLMRTVLISVERQPALLECDRQTLFNGAMTFAVLGLEVDGVTGQGYLLPFNDRKNSRKIVQPIIGYKGFNTLGARAGMTIGAAIVREGDDFDFSEGSAAFVRHKKKLGGEKDRRIVAAWATATSNDRPAIVKVLSIDEINAVKERSPRGREPPWADPAIGFPAMSEKTAKRRLARDMPLTVFQLAARLDEAFEEQGRPAWIAPDRNLVVDGEIIAPRHSTDTPTMEALTASRLSLADWDLRLADQARQGMDALEACWEQMPREFKSELKRSLETKHKQVAAQADAKRNSSALPSHGAADAGTTAATVPADDPPMKGPPSLSVDTAGGGSNLQQPPPVAGSSFLSQQDKVALARQRGRDDRAKGVKRSATPTEYRAPDRTAEAFAWVEGWNEKS